jgi:hypothetical protein
MDRPTNWPTDKKGYSLVLPYQCDCRSIPLFANLDQTAERKPGDVSRQDSLGSGCARGQEGTEGGSLKRRETEQRPGLERGGGGGDWLAGGGGQAAVRTGEAGRERAVRRWAGE